MFNRCAIPELSVVHNDKLWEDEKRKFRKETPEVGKDQEELNVQSIPSGRKTRWRPRDNRKDPGVDPEPSWGEAREPTATELSIRNFLYNPSTRNKVQQEDQQQVLGPKFYEG